VTPRYLCDVGNYGMVGNGGLQILLNEPVANTSSNMLVRYGATGGSVVTTSNIFATTNASQTRWLCWGSSNQTSTYKSLAGSGLTFSKTTGQTRSANTTANTVQARVGALNTNFNPMSCKLAVYGFVRGLELTSTVAAQFGSWATTTFGALA